MPEYLSPGVYVEEIDAGPRPIAGVSTSTTGMVGVTARGPIDGKPLLVTNLLEYQQTFGGFLPVPEPGLRAQWSGNALEGGQYWTFAQSVQGFFDNGGQRLYVKRVAAGGADPSTGAFGHGCFAAITADAAQAATTLEVAHLFGFAGNGTPVAIVRGSDGADILTTTVDSYRGGSAPSIVLADPLPEPVRVARGDSVRVGAAPAAPVGTTDVTLTVSASSPGTWGDGVQVRVSPVASASLTFRPDPGEGELFVARIAATAAADSGTLVVSAAANLAATAEARWVLVAGTRLPVESITAQTAGQPGDFVLTLAAGSAHDEFGPGTLVRRVRRINPDTTADTFPVSGASRLYPGARVQIDDGENLLMRSVDAITGDRVRLNQAFGSTLFETAGIILVEAMIATRFADETGRLITENLGPVRLAAAATAAESAETISSGSQLVRLVRGPAISADPASFPAVHDGGWLTLANGDDDLGSLSTADFVGADGGSGKRTGIRALEDIDDIALCAVPGLWSGTVQSALITHCELLKDRFAILDPQDGLSIQEVQAFRDSYDTRYAALYHPWLVIPDPLGGPAAINVPPSGHLAGIYARTDVERGVHKAPANTIVRGVRTRDGFDQDITKRQQDVLNPRGINALRFFPGMGHRVWGARTLSSDSSWKYINVRRLFIYIEESIDEGTQWAVFEPNSEALWALIRQSVTDFLTTTWRSGALAGTKASEAFFVACDRTTMTEDDLQNGRLICVIGVAPVFPAEFVIFRIQQKTREAQLT